MSRVQRNKRKAVSKSWMIRLDRRSEKQFNKLDREFSDNRQLLLYLWGWVYLEPAPVKGIGIYGGYCGCRKCKADRAVLS